jgi:2,3-bisphosphoglycerate-dependent phosphoglycerate mutase
MHIYLIRHGEKEATKNNPGLTTTGITQAQKTARYLAQFPITKIIASPYLRTQQTAGHIAQHLNLSIVTDERLRERMDFQEFEGDRAAFFAEWSKATHDRSYVPVSGRSSEETASQVIALLHELESEAAQHSHIALVTHGGTIADFLRSVFDEPVTSPLRYTFAEDEDYRIDECSVTRVTKVGSLFASHDLHYTAHLG